MRDFKGVVQARTSPKRVRSQPPSLARWRCVCSSRRAWWPTFSAVAAASSLRSSAGRGAKQLVVATVQERPHLFGRDVAALVPTLQANRGGRPKKPVAPAPTRTDLEGGSTSMPIVGPSLHDGHARRRRRPVVFKSGTQTSRAEKLTAGFVRSRSFLAGRALLGRRLQRAKRRQPDRVSNRRARENLRPSSPRHRPRSLARAC